MSEDLKQRLMVREAFSDASPGELVPIELHKKRTTVDGLIEIDSVPSLAFVPNELPPDLDWQAIKGELFEPLSGAIAALANLDGLIRRAPSEGILQHALWIREAKLSSEIENIHTTALDIVLAESRAPTEERDPGRETWNAMRAVEHGLKSDLPFSNRLISEMHRVLMSTPADRRQRPGEYRDIPVCIGPENMPERARFVPPPPGNMPGQVGACMAALERWVNADSDEIPHLIRVALMHYQFESIHPFRDGNGRIGRALIMLQICRRRLIETPVISMSGYLQRNKQEYVDRLHGVSTTGDWIGWIRFFAEGVATATVETRVLCDRLSGIYEGASDHIRGLGAPVRLLQLLEKLFRWPVVTAKSAEKLLGVTNPTARKDIDMLVEMGFLRITEDVSYGKAWYAPAILSVVEATDEDIERELTG